MSLKHMSPAPWFVRTSRDHIKIVFVDQNLRGEMRDFTIAEMGYELPFMMNEANAHLIAAAPEMLEALRHCASAIKHANSGDGAPTSDQVMDLADASANARAVIAKAEGR